MIPPQGGTAAGGFPKLDRLQLMGLTECVAQQHVYPFHPTSKWGWGFHGY